MLIGYLRPHGDDAAIRLHPRIYRCIETACELRLCETTTSACLVDQRTLRLDLPLVHELRPLRHAGQADQLHAPHALPHLRLLAGFDQALGDEARLAVAGAVRVGIAYDPPLGVAQVYPGSSHPAHSGWAGRTCRRPFSRWRPGSAAAAATLDDAAQDDTKIKRFGMAWLRALLS